MSIPAVEREVVIQPLRGVSALRLGELLRYRELLFFLIWRDIKVRYKQTLFGAAWAIMQPLLLMLVFWIFLGRLANVPSEGVPYTVFAYTALVPWTLFAQSVQGSTLSLVSSSNLVSKVYFPRLLLPMASVGSYVVDFLIAFTLLIGMMALYGVTPTSAIVWLPAFLILAIATALAVGFLLSALNARFRDIQYAVPFIVQLWLFLSPVAYPSSLVKGPWAVVYGLNPMAGVVEGFRWALLGLDPPPAGLFIASIAVTLCGLFASILFFQTYERRFADVI